MTRRERLEARAEKRREWAESRDRKSAAGFEAARRIADGIPFGQPILVGHHSEGRARRDQGRIHSGMSQGVESQKMAEHHRYKAANLEGALEKTIFSDDHDAVERLTEKIASLEEQRDFMKAVNAAYRKGGIEGLRKFHEPACKAFLLLKGRCSYETKPYPSYSLSNLGATIRTAKKRIEAIQAEASGEVTRTMISRFDSECARCGGAITKGTEIGRVSGEWGHKECPGKG